MTDDLDPLSLSPTAKWLSMSLACRCRAGRLEAANDRPAPRLVRLAKAGRGGEVMFAMMKPITLFVSTSSPSSSTPATRVKHP